MRARRTSHGLTAHLVAGTHTVLIGMDLKDPTGCLGFAIRRTDHTEGETVWLRGMKTFRSVADSGRSSAQWSTRWHPIQAFQWGDYTAKPGHSYTYAISALVGTPAAPELGATVAVNVRTEVEDDGVHGVWFNRGVAGSQAFSRRFPDWVPQNPPDEANPAMVWLSRGLGEALLAFIAEAVDDDWGLRGAFYEFTWGRALEAFAAARDRGVDVQLVVHGRDRDSAGSSEDNDRTAALAREAVQRHGIPDLVTWREAPNKSALQHNKFLVLTHKGQPVAVWTGSTNITLGAIYGHSNVGHLVRSRALAAQFDRYWRNLKEGLTTPALREIHESEPPLAPTVPAPPGATFVPSPRQGLAALQWYAALFDSATTSAHITGAFGLNAVFLDRLAQLRAPITRTVLLEKLPPRDRAVPRTDSHVRISTGSHLAGGGLGQWAAERLTGFNSHVQYIHTKIVLVDPLTEHPTVLTGSANYSDASTVSNEENTLVLCRGRTRATSQRAILRVADIYLTEYHRLFMHFPFRALAQSREVNTGQPRTDQYLEETDSWARRYYETGSWRAAQRALFSAARQLVG